MNNDVVFDYAPILVFAILAFGLGTIIILLPFIFSKRKSYIDKNKSYECGFDPFAESRHRFDIRFYLVAILFIIFDLEIAFLFPWATVIKTIGILGFSSMMIFLLVLTIGFIYEWKKGALEWE